EIYTWDYFVVILRFNPAISFRWFGVLPPGLSVMSDSAPNKLAFKQFLNYDILPYFSRALFLSYIESQSYVSEDEWVDSLDSGNKQAALLFGPGGIGKTRLGMELCRRLRARGWLTLKVERVAAADSVDSILRAHVKPARIILFLDYAEAAGNL